MANEPHGGSELTLDGVSMRVAGTAVNGVVDAATQFAFRQTGAVVTATYAGGTVRAGVLTGVLRGAVLEFRYAQVEADLSVHGGHSHAHLRQLTDGRLQLMEEFTWESRAGSGTNVFEEIAAPVTPDERW